MNNFSFRKICAIFLYLLSINLFAQYYDGISTSSATFVSDLQTLIRSNYTKLSYDLYDENMIPGFYAVDNGDGSNSVFCVYTGYEFVYTGTFAWTEFSREHTWCYSWMPTFGSTSGEEYSDYHHLFPTHQNNANARRSNHPLGNVAVIDYQYLDGKLGWNSNGDVVYEPRDAQKGDAARALFYMALRYDGINGNDWSFSYLNNTTLPNLSNPESPQDLQTLIAWHELDPPDAFEISRNDYIQNIQGNRNPFIDHPEFVYYIDFNDMTKKSSSILPEPTNHILSFSAVGSSNSQIDLSWSENDGTIVPDGYLIKVSSTDYTSIANPVDGTSESNDLDLSDGEGAYNISHGNSTYSWTGLNSNTIYYFKIYSFTNSGSDIDFKTDGTIPLTTAATTNESIPNLLISEYVEGSSNNKAIELYNPGNLDVDLAVSNYSLEFYFNGGTSASTSISLIGTISANDVFVISDNDSDPSILAVADLTSSSSFFNGDDAIILKKGTTIIDVIGQIGVDPGSEWGSGLTSTQDNTLRRKASIVSGDSNPDDAFDPSIEWVGYASDTFDGLGNPSPLPVELISFTGYSNENSIQLDWETATEINNFGFEIHRTSNSDNSGWNKIGFVEGNGNSVSPKNYTFIDNQIILGKAYSYRLKQIDFDGKFEYSEILKVNSSVPNDFNLGQNFPNPFNPTTSIEFTLPTNNYVTLKVYDVLGNILSTLVNENKEAGKYNVTFDASNLSSGIYFYSLTAGSYSQIKKMLLVK